jgi:hypothetical protein
MSFPENGPVCVVELDSAYDTESQQKQVIRTNINQKFFQIKTFFFSPPPPSTSDLFPIRINLEIWVLQTVDRIPWKGNEPCRKAATYAEHKHTRNADRHTYLEWNYNTQSNCLSGRRPCLRPHDHCYRLNEDPHSVNPAISYLRTHGAEPFLRSRQFCSYSRISQHFMEPEDSLPCL